MPSPDPPPLDPDWDARLVAKVRDCIRLKHYSIRTEQAVCDWIKRFIRFHGKRHPAELGAPEVEATHRTAVPVFTVSNVRSAGRAIV